MVADSDGQTLTAVVICEGNLTDPDFPDKLSELVGKLTTLIHDNEEEDEEDDSEEDDIQIDSIDNESTKSKSRRKKSELKVSKVNIY